MLLRQFADAQEAVAAACMAVVPQHNAMAASKAAICCATYVVRMTALIAEMKGRSCALLCPTVVGVLKVRLCLRLVRIFMYKGLPAASLANTPLQATTYN